MKSLKLVLAAILLTGATAKSALYTTSYTWKPGVDGWTHSFDIYQIDTTGWGVLASVKFVLTGHISSDVTVKNNNVFYVNNVAWQLSGVVAGSYGATDLPLNSNPTATSSENLSASELRTHYSVSGEQSVDTTSYDSTLLSGFQGTGYAPHTFDVVSTNLTFSVNPAIAGINGSGSGISWAQLDVIYDVVPEPGTWISAAMLFGVVGVGTSRSLWRKRQSTSV
ncbi:MAG: choice-of-anchor E domain-containing protein [Verrucomicrobiota bacterium]